jgi:hypothetical protein
LGWVRLSLEKGGYKPMYKFQIKILGTAPLRHNALTKQVQSDIRTKKISKKKTDEELLEEAKRAIYRDDKGEICVESRALKACGKNGAGRVRLGKRSFVQDFKALIRFQDRFIPLLNDKGKRFKEPTNFHFEFVKIPPGPKGTPQPKMWGYFDPWQLETTGYVLEDDISLDIVKEAFGIGGSLFGLLDGRPDWGTFEVKEIKRIVE